MPIRNFITRTEADEHDAVMDAIAGRENELASYDANVEGYTKQIAAMNAALPAEWPAELAKFKGKSNEQIFAMGASDADALLASQLNHRERVKLLLFTEQAERRKSEGSYAHCLSCLPTDPAKLQAAKDRYDIKKAAQKAKNP